MKYSYQIKLEISRILSGISPEWASRFLYRRSFKRKLDLGDPKTLNEKIQWLKLNTYRDDPLVTLCTDKLAVRSYVASRGFADCLNELYGVWESPEQIRLEELPDSFALKCNHGCGYNVLCRDKAELDFPAVKKQLAKWLHTDYWKYFAELQYQNIPRRILCEKFIGTRDTAPCDYKIYCFNGKPAYILVCEGRETGWPSFYFFDTDWNFCRITRDGKKAPADFSRSRPASLDRMLACAESLAEPFPYVRIDFYEHEGRPIFGEMTFTPSAGLDERRLPETDAMFGDMVDLSYGADYDREKALEACRRIDL